MAEVDDSDLQQMLEIEEYMHEHGLIEEEPPQDEYVKVEDAADGGYDGDDPEIAYELHMDSVLEAVLLRDVARLRHLLEWSDAAVSRGALDAAIALGDPQVLSILVEFLDTRGARPPPAQPASQPRATTSAVSAAASRAPPPVFRSASLVERDSQQTVQTVMGSVLPADEAEEVVLQETPAASPSTSPPPEATTEQAAQDAEGYRQLLDALVAGSRAAAAVAAEARAQSATSATSGSPGIWSPTADEMRAGFATSAAAAAAAQARGAPPAPAPAPAAKGRDAIRAAALASRRRRQAAAGAPSAAPAAPPPAAAAPAATRSDSGGLRDDPAAFFRRHPNPGDPAWTALEEAFLDRLERGASVGGEVDEGKEEAGAEGEWGGSAAAPAGGARAGLSDPAAQQQQQRQQQQQQRQQQQGVAAPVARSTPLSPLREALVRGNYDLAVRVAEALSSDVSDDDVQFARDIGVPRSVLSVLAVHARVPRGRPEQQQQQQQPRAATRLQEAIMSKSDARVLACLNSETAGPVGRTDVALAIACGCSPRLVKLLTDFAAADAVVALGTAAAAAQAAATAAAQALDAAPTEPRARASASTAAPAPAPPAPSPPTAAPVPTTASPATPGKQQAPAAPVPAGGGGTGGTGTPAFDGAGTAALGAARPLVTPASPRAVVVTGAGAPTPLRGSPASPQPFHTPLQSQRGADRSRFGAVGGRSAAESSSAGGSGGAAAASSTSGEGGLLGMRTPSLVALQQQQRQAGQGAVGSPQPPASRLEL